MKKVFKPETMKYIRYVTWPAISETSDRIAWVCWEGDEKSGLFKSAVHVLENGNERLLTPEGENEKQPFFLPDGVSMAYLSDKSGEFQVYVRSLETGEARQVTHLRHGVTRFSLSADASALVFEATLWPSETEGGLAFSEMDSDEKKKWEDELDWMPYEITTLTYKMDEWHGMRKGEFSHIGTVKLDGSDERIIDTNGMEAVFPVWSHDAKRLAFYGYPHDGARGRQAELFVCDASGENLMQLTSKDYVYADNAPAFLQNDEGVICMTFADYGDGSSVMIPLLVNIGDKSAKALIGEWDEKLCHGVHPIRAGALEYGDKTSYFSLTADGKYMYFLTGRHGRFDICRVEIPAKKELARPVELVLKGESDIQEFAMNAAGELVIVQASWKQPAELWKDGRQLTHSNDWLDEYELAEVEEHWIKSSDNKADIQYFLVRPAGWREGTQYPAVLDIKGGPDTMYGLSFWHEFQALAGAGMAVIFGNPRGSTGFGREYCANGVCWGAESMNDLLAFVEDAERQGWIDKDRVGVTGGSYGGYMTNKLIGRTNVFAAAVTQRCLANTATSYGTGDMGFVSAAPLKKHFRMLKYLENRARGNIISYIDNFNVPLLILHAYEDYRCGFEQAEQVFIPMKERHPDIPVRLVMFPGENHGLTRGGKLYHQIRHLKEMTDWFVKYLEEMPDWRVRTAKKEASDENEQYK